MKIQKLWFEDEKIFILTDDGKTLWQSLLWYPRLKQATEAQRMNFAYDEIGIHWPDVDEDVSVESFLYDNPEPTDVSRLFLTHPELNVSAVARRMGIQQSLLAAYIRGTKKPSPNRIDEIRDTVRQIGIELAAV